MKSPQWLSKTYREVKHATTGANKKICHLGQTTRSKI
jgi:hypothetical protein